MLKSRAYRYKRQKLSFIVYDKNALMSMREEFKEHRNYDSWEEYFTPKLKKQKEGWGYKKRSYKDLSARFPRRIVNLFIHLLTEDLLDRDIEFVLNPRAKKENQFILKVGYIKKLNKHRTEEWKGYNYYEYAGVPYALKLQYPKNWPTQSVQRKAYFMYWYRYILRRKLKMGHRYYNSAEEHLLNQL